MKLYEHKERAQYKWLFGAILFLLALSVTFTDVYGLNFIPMRPSAGRNATIQPEQLNNLYAYSDKGQGTTIATPTPPLTPTPVPEPTTLVLLGAGLGAAYLRRLRAR